MWELLSTRVLFGSLSPLEMFSTAALCWVGLGLVDVLSAFLVPAALRSGDVQTWLILPVVICLSQRLSHACLSINTYTVKLRMAH